MVLIHRALFAIVLGIFSMTVSGYAQAQVAETDTILSELPMPVLDIAMERIEPGTIKFTPVFENIEIGQVQWDFGDGSYSRLRYPTHHYGILAFPRLVTLTINNDEKLSVSRLIFPTINYDFESRFYVEIEAQTIEPFFGNYIPENHKDHIRRLSEMPSFHNLQSYLIWMSREDIISAFGSRGDMRNANWSYIIMVDPQRGNVETILGPVYNRYRYDLTSVPERKYKNNEWQTRLSGLRPIWIQFK